MTMTEARRLLVRARKWMDPNLDQDARDIDAWLAANPEGKPAAGVTEALDTLVGFTDPESQADADKIAAACNTIRALASAVPKPDAGVTEAVAKMRADAADELQRWSKFLPGIHTTQPMLKRAIAALTAVEATAVPAAAAGRTPEQFAIEHGRYLVTAVEALLRRVGRGVPMSGEDYLAVRSAIHEFTKRADRAYAPPSKDTAPAVAATSPGETAGNKGD